MLRLLLVRHGQTAWNAQGRNQGTADIPLDEVGFRQSEQVAGALLSERIKLVYSSNLMRAVQTAEEIANRSGVTITVDDRLRERDYGDWEGLTSEEIHLRSPEALRIYRSDPSFGSPPNGESGIDVFARSGYFLLTVLEEHKVGNVVIVSHGGTISNLLAALLNASPSSASCFRIFNCGITEVVIRENQRRLLRRYNDTSHLDPKPLDLTFAGSAAH